MIYELTSEKLTVKIDSYGAELVSAVGEDGYEHVWQGMEGFWSSHAPLLFPVCGRLLNSEYVYGGVRYDMQGHGFACRSEFTATAVERNRLTLVLESSDATRAIYPFEFRLTADFTLMYSTLTMKLTVENLDEKTLPYMIGWHPAFNLEDSVAIGDYSLRLGSGDTVEWYPLQNGCFARPYGEDYTVPMGEYRLNEEEIYSNDTMIFKGTGDTAYLYAKGARHTVNLDWSDNLPFLCIWKEDSSAAKFICLEPWSDIPADGVIPENFEERKMSRLRKGECESYTYTVKLN